MNLDPPVNLFLILPVLPEKKMSFQQCLLHNARTSRNEAGCLSFDVFVPESPSDTFFLFEQWASQKDLDSHGQQQHLAALRQMLPESLSGPRTTLRLSQLFGDASERKPLPGPPSTRNVIVVLSVSPEHRETLINALSDAIADCRRATGNLTFEVYQDQADPNTLLLLERWVDVESHEKHLQADYLLKLHAVMEQTLAEPLMDRRYLLTDLLEKEAKARS